MLPYHGVVVNHISGIWHWAQACFCNFPGVAPNALAAILPWDIRRRLVRLHLHHVSMSPSDGLKKCCAKETASRQQSMSLGNSSLRQTRALLPIHTAPEG